MAFFTLKHQDKNSHLPGRQAGARLGEMTTDHGVIQTPIFMPVGTQAAVKTLDSTDIKNIGSQIILGNNYHLHLRPGEDTIAAHGGLHKFMNWDGPILTDSGGFQVFSLGLQKDTKAVKNIKSMLPNSQSKLVAIDEDGVTFKSHIDGSTHRFTPESAIECEHKIGADIIMAFDECTPDDAPREYVVAAMERTHRWAVRSLNEHRRLNDPTSILPLKREEDVADSPLFKEGRRGGQKYHQFLFGIIQGAGYRDLREQSAEFISNLPFDGVAIGGESIGYNMAATANILDWVYPYLPENKPHYAMGIGLNPTDLLVAVEHGIDMFDCVAPTRLARHGMVFIWDKEKGHRLNIKNAAFKNDTAPLDGWCDCSTCQNYSRSYLHHLFAADEMTALRLASIHNLRFMLKLMEETRAAIGEDKFGEYKQKWI